TSCKVAIHPAKGGRPCKLQSRPMTNPSDCYKLQVETHSETLKNIKNRLERASSLRLLIFIAACVVIYFALENAKNEIAFVIVIVFVTIGLFVLVVTRHNRLKYERDLTNTLIAQNETELQVLNRNFHHLPSGEKYKNPLHFYSQDIDLFGRGSFFQY